jgi:hypothetical protein
MPETNASGGARFRGRGWQKRIADSGWRIADLGWRMVKKLREPRRMEARQRSD